MARKSTEAIVLHCTATLAHQDFRRSDIDAMHRRRGFKNGIGYHYLITRAGKVEVGRSPDTSVGAHVQNFNDRTIGIAYVGGLRTGDAKPMDTRTPAQTKALIELLKKLLKSYPNAVILGHRDLSPDLDRDGVVEPNEYMKQCPCFSAGPWAVSVGLPGGYYRDGKFKSLLKLVQADSIVATQKPVQPVPHVPAPMAPHVAKPAPVPPPAPPVVYPEEAYIRRTFWEWLADLFRRA